MKVVIVGSGNVAYVLSALIQKSGHEIVQVVGRSANRTKALASIYDAGTADLYEPRFAVADIYIVALADVALNSIERVTALKNKFVVHTAGPVSIEILKDSSSSYGVLYPLQTLSKMTGQIPEVPFLVDGSTKEVLDKITGFAESLSGSVATANDLERLHYHIAAVFVSNFTNHLFAIAEKFCEKEKITFKNLLPLINEVTSRVNVNSPYDVQTGPAIREDVSTLTLHLQTLSSYPDMKYLYLKLSESILKLHEKKRHGH